MRKICPDCERVYPADHARCEADGATLLQLRSSGVPPPLIGQTVDGRYLIESLLGVGGMGSVYRARQVSMHRPVALKVLRQDASGDPAAVRRFLREVQAVSMLSHPNTITVYDFGQAPDGLLYIAMEYLEGRSLGAILDEDGPLPPERALRVAGQVASALAEAHEKGVIHRDLKPDNVMLAEVGGRRDHAKVVDFGIAKLRGAGGRITRTGTTIGTPAYLSPEAAEGKTELTPAVDLYALGCLLFECLTGRVPFPGDDPVSVAMAQMSAPVPTFESVRAGLSVPHEVESLVRSLLEKDPDSRPASAEVLLEHLGTLREHVRGMPRRDPAVERAALVAEATLDDVTPQGRGPVRPSHSAAGTILVASGDDACLDRLRRLLEVEGYAVVAAGDGPAALRAMASRQIDVVLADAALPAVDGVEVCRRIRCHEAHAAVPLVLLAPQGDSRAREAGRRAGCDELLTRPVDPQELSARTGALLELRRARERLAAHDDLLEDLVAERNAELHMTLEMLEESEREVRASREETIRRLARAAELRDDEPSRHIQRLAHYCEILARRAGLPDGQCARLLAASPLHDLGKLGVPEAVLLKPGRYTPSEHALMQRHTTIGHALLDGSHSELLATAATVARSHHENFDGSGYPDGLAGDAIPVASRICRIADAFDGLTTRRVYKPAVPVGRSIEILAMGRGSMFDPALLDLFLDSLERVLTVKEMFPDPEETPSATRQ